MMGTGAANPVPGEQPSFSAGDWVRIERFRAAGRIVRLNSNGNCEVLSGHVTYQVTVQDLRPAEPPQAPALPSLYKRFSVPEGPTPLVRELDLHGLRCKAADAVLWREIYRAREGNSHRILKVIHGVGDGVLARRVQEIAAEAGLRCEPDPRGGLAATLVFID